MNDREKKKPEAEFKDRGLNVKIWRNKSEKTDRDFFNASITKVYKDRNDQWQESRSFDRDDLLRLRDLLGRASVEMLMLQDQEQTNQRSQINNRSNLSEQRDEVLNCVDDRQAQQTRSNSRSSARER